LTLLSLKNFAKLAEIEEKFIFPYKILDQNIEQYMEIKKEYFNNSYDYTIFVNKYGNNPNIFEILKEYCINDTYITKKAINRF
jgi:hypothetical protein